jgi:hypothetical protein
MAGAHGRWTRRGFLGAAAAATAAIAGGATYGAIRLRERPQPVQPSAPPAPRTARYRTRPDLTPPVITVTANDRDVAQGLLFVTPLAGNARSGPLILDGAGEPVWFLPIIGKNRFAADLRVQRLRGEPVLTWWEGLFNGSGGEGEYVVADASYRELRRFSAGRGARADLHELILTPGGTAVLIEYRRVTAAGRAVYDCVIEEVDLASGDVRFEWRALDHVPVADSYLPAPSDRSTPYDYFHLNSLQRDEGGDIVISARHTSAIYKLDRRTGDVIWTMNGKSSDFAIEPDARFGYQHDARFHPDGLLSLFDNAEMEDRAGKRSRGLLLEVDEERRTVRLVREYVHPRRLLSTSQANLQRLKDGGALIGWGSQPYVSEFSAGGRLRFDAHFDAGLQSYRAYRLDWGGRPSDAPAVATQVTGPGAVDVYASWNGATDVATWEVHAGTAADPLVPVATAARRGFETRIPCRIDAGHVAVMARNAAGAVLGTSSPTRIA